MYPILYGVVSVLLLPVILTGMLGADLHSAHRQPELPFRGFGGQPLYIPGSCCRWISSKFCMTPHSSGSTSQFCYPSVHHKRASNPDHHGLNMIHVGHCEPVIVCESDDGVINMIYVCYAASVEHCVQVVL